MDMMMIDELLYSSLYTNALLTLIFGLMLKNYLTTEMIKERLSELREIRQMVNEMFYSQREQSQKDLGKGK